MKIEKSAMKTHVNSITSAKILIPAWAATWALTYRDKRKVDNKPVTATSKRIEEVRNEIYR